MAYGLHNFFFLITHCRQFNMATTPQCIVWLGISYTWGKPPASIWHTLHFSLIDVFEQGSGVMKGIKGFIYELLSTQNYDMVYGKVPLHTTE